VDVRWRVHDRAGRGWWSVWRISRELRTHGEPMCVSLHGCAMWHVGWSFASERESELKRFPYKGSGCVCAKGVVRILCDKATRRCTVDLSMPGNPGKSAVADHGQLVYHNNMNINIGPNGGSVTLLPKALAMMTGVDPDKIGPCAAALALDHVKIVNSNLPVDCVGIFTAGNGERISHHCANHITADGGVAGVHAVLRHGNIHHGLNMVVNLQPHDGKYSKEGTRKQLMQNALKTAENWSGHRGKKAHDIYKSSIHDQLEDTDVNTGIVHKRALVHKNSLVGKLVEMNPDSTHPVMSLYSKKKLKEAQGKYLMLPEHVDDLAKTLETTLAPCTAISEHGLKFTVKPMEHSENHIEEGESYTGQIGFELSRSRVDQVAKGHDAESDATGVIQAVTTTELGTQNGEGKTHAERTKEIFAMPVGGGASVVASGDARSVDVGAAAAAMP